MIAGVLKKSFYYINGFGFCLSKFDRVLIFKLGIKK